MTGISVLNTVRYIHNMLGLAKSLRRDMLHPKDNAYRYTCDGDFARALLVYFSGKINVESSACVWALSVR